MVVDLRMAETAVKSLWKDKMTVTEHQPYKKPDKTTAFRDVDVITDEPCKIIFKTVNAVDQQEAARLAQSVELLCDKSLEIKEGSKIVITHEGRTTSYQRSGMPAVYSVHQEILLEPFERWA